MTLRAVGGTLKSATGGALAGLVPTPGAVRTLAAGTPGAAGFTITWLAPSSGTAVDHYAVTISPGGSSNVTGALTKVFTGLTGSTTYTVSVAAVDAGGNVGPTSILQVTTAVTPTPGIPTSLATGSLTATGFTATWAAPVSGVAVDHYWVTISPASGSYSVSGLSKAFTGLSAETEYTVTVQGVDVGGNYGPIATIKATTPAAATTPVAPTGLAAGTPTSSGFSVSWIAPTDGAAVDHYEVTLTPGGVTSVSGLSTSFTGLTASTSYTVAVKSVTAGGVKSAASTITVSTAVAPPPPVNPITTVGYGSALDGTTTVDSTKWTAKKTGNYYTGTGYTQLANGKLRILTPSTAQTYSAYAKIQGLYSQQSGKVSGSFVTTNKNEHRIYVGAFTSVDPNNGNEPDGWMLNFLPVSNSVQFSRFVSGVETIIGTAATITFSSGGDTVYYEIQPGLGATVWLNGASKPSSPNFPATGATTPAFPQSAKGFMYYKLNSGGSAEVITLDFSPVTFDALDGPHLAAAPSDAAISSNLAKPYADSGTMALAWTIDFEDTFSSGSSLDSAKWVDHEPYEGSPGMSGGSVCWCPVPATNVTVAGGNLTMAVRRTGGLPSGYTHTGAKISTRGKYATQAISGTKKTFIEARLKVSSGAGLWPSLWTEGDGDLHVDGNAHTGWPVKGENDIFEFFNYKNGIGYPFWSLHFPADVYSDPPGTWLNDTHAYQTTPAALPDLMDSFHTWGLYIDLTTMKVFIDGTLKWTFTQGQVYTGTSLAIPAMLFTNPQFIRLSHVVGDYAGTGWSNAEYQDGDLTVDYVRVFKI